jgi:hypothetical protein
VEESVVETVGPDFEAYSRSRELISTSMELPHQKGLSQFEINTIKIQALTDRENYQKNHQFGVILYLLPNSVLSSTILSELVEFQKVFRCM